MLHLKLIFSPIAKSLLVITTLFLGGVFLPACSPKTAATPTTQTGSANHLITHTLNSQYPEQERIVSVQLPRSYDQEPSRHYPVLYILDGNQNLEMTTTIVTSLVDTGQMPEVIIVGLHSGKTRRADYLPGHPTSKRDGLANRFLEHIETELLPFIEQEYRVSPYRILSGHSWGALFTTFALTENPDLFDGYLAQSPNLGKRWTPYFLARVESLLERSPNLETIYFMVIGSERKSQSGFDQLTVLFEQKAPNGFSWAAKKHPNASHMQTRQPGMREGLIHIFAKKQPQQRPAD